MGTLPGVYEAKKKDGSLYYRTSITYHSKHISIGSYNKEEAANAAYREARKLLDTNTLYSPDDYHPDDFPHLSYQKWICLINFRNNGFYIKTPIYLYQKFFSYHLSPSDILLFDADDLFYYSKHSIMRRGNHLFVAEYGMQTNIHSRYGIKNFAREGIDYQFVNGDPERFPLQQYRDLQHLSWCNTDRQNATFIRGKDPSERRLSDRKICHFIGSRNRI